MEDIASLLGEVVELVVLIFKKHRSTERWHTHHFMGVPDQGVGFFDAFDVFFFSFGKQGNGSVGTIYMKPKLMFLTKISNGIQRVVQACGGSTSIGHYRHDSFSLGYLLVVGAF